MFTQILTDDSFESVHGPHHTHIPSQPHPAPSHISKCTHTLTPFKQSLNVIVTLNNSCFAVLLSNVCAYQQKCHGAFAPLTSLTCILPHPLENVNFWPHLYKFSCWVLWNLKLSLWHLCIRHDFALFWCSHNVQQRHGENQTQYCTSGLLRKKVYDIYIWE
jgi:hypothetical protein